MIAENDVKTYDFRKPSRLPDDIEHRLTGWLRGTCLLVPEVWSERMERLLSVTASMPEAMPVSDALAILPDPAVGYRVSLSADAIRTILVFSRQLGMVLAAEMLGEALDEMPEERDLTAVERSLCELAVKDWVRALSESWPDQEPIACMLRETEPRPQRSRLFPAKDKSILCQFEVSGTWGTQPLWWVLPHDPILELLLQNDEFHQDKPTDENRHDMQALARDIPVQVVVRLGETALHVADLASLSSGDVVILDQRITESLVAEIAGEPMYRAWPGRVGMRQAIQIESIVED